MKKFFKFGLTACLATAFVFAGCKKDDDDSKFAVTLSANNAEWGTVAGGGEFAEGTEIQIMATANSGYHFEKWSDDDTNNPRTITVDKNIALIAIFAEGNGSGTVNGGGNNNQGNTGIATGDILPKKVSKIVETYSKNSELRETITYLFDTNGRIVSETKVDEREDDTSIKTYTYTDNTIVKQSSSKCVFNIENGRIVSDTLDDGGTGKYIYPSTYTYTSDGYIESIVTISKDNGNIIEKRNFTVAGGNIISCNSYFEGDEDRTTFTFGDKPNNLNVDITLLFYNLNYPTGYLGNRNKNLPSSFNDLYKPQNAADNGEQHIGEFAYTYNGDYLTKIVCIEKSSDSKTYEYTYEIFYEE